MGSPINNNYFKNLDEDPHIHASHNHPLAPPQKPFKIDPENPNKQKKGKEKKKDKDGKEIDDEENDKPKPLPRPMGL